MITDRIGFHLTSDPHPPSLMQTRGRKKKKRLSDSTQSYYNHFAYIVHVQKFQHTNWLRARQLIQRIPRKLNCWQNVESESRKLKLIACILQTSNQMSFLPQVETNKHSLTFLRLEKVLSSGVRLLLELYCVIVTKHVAFFTICAKLLVTMAFWK